MAKHATRNRHLPEADDRFVEALLEEHARLGSGDDLALLALIRARTEEQPESGHRTSSSRFGVRQWLQVAAVVTLIGVALTFAFRHFSPGNSSSSPNNRFASSPTDSSADQTAREPEYTIRIRNAAAASSSATQLSADGSDAVDKLLASEWYSPLTQPLSMVPYQQAGTAGQAGALSLDDIQTLLTAGNPLHPGAITVSSLLAQLPLTKPESSDDAIHLSVASCPWNPGNQLVHLHIDRTQVEPAAVALRSSAPISDMQFPVFSQIDPAFPSSTVSLSAGADELYRELIRIALAKLTKMALGDASTAPPELVIEFNPAQVSSYRLLGHATNFEGQLTALYEIRNADPADSDSSSPVADLKYQPTNASEDLLTAQFGAEESSIARTQTSSWKQADQDLQLTAAAALFAKLVDSDQPPSREVVGLLKRLLNGSAATAPEIEQFRAVIALWSRSAIAQP